MSTKVSITSANLMSFFQIQERKNKRRRQFFADAERKLLKPRRHSRREMPTVEVN